MTTMTATWTTDTDGILTILDGPAQGRYPFNTGTTIEAGALCLGATTLTDGRIINLKVALTNLPGLAEEFATRRAAEHTRHQAAHAARLPQHAVDVAMRRAGFQASGNAAALSNQVGQ